MTVLSLCTALPLSSLYTNTCVTPCVGVVGQNGPVNTAAAIDDVVELVCQMSQHQNRYSWFRGVAPDRQLLSTGTRMANANSPYNVRVEGTEYQLVLWYKSLNMSGPYTCSLNVSATSLLMDMTAQLVLVGECV